jgi:4-diphosphocytidyl-2C-methyl-D-erythritol kinase
MTGSGSAVFAHVSEEKLNQFAQLQGEPKGDLNGAVVKLCSNLAEHPLKSWAN